MPLNRIAIIHLVIITLLIFTGCMEHSPCTAYPDSQVSPDGSGKIEVRYWVCKRGLFNKERYTTVDVGITKWGGLSDRVFRIENKHQITAEWVDPNHVVLICHDVNGDRISEQEDRLTLSALIPDPAKPGVTGRERLSEVSERISITYDLK